jgi:23S rRNA (uracil1939-C5)-methyltransferase
MPEEFSLSIEKLVYGGEGLGHAAGQTVFVPYVLPGEEVRAATVSRNKKLIRASLVEVLASSKERTAPSCRHFGTCGGCHYQHLGYEAQLRFKTEILRETLSRLGGIRWEAEIVQHASPPFGYRNRAQWAIKAGPKLGIGYFLPGSAEICEVTECPVLSPLLAETFADIRSQVESARLPGLKGLEAFVDSSDQKVALNAAFDRFSKPATELAAAFRGAVPRLESLLMNEESSKKFELTGPGFIEHEVGGFRFRVSHLSFFQVNRFLAAELLDTVTHSARGRLAVDLYAGVGFFSVPLARKFEKVISVDANLASTRDLRANAEAAGVNIQWHHEQVDAFLGRPRAKPDLVVLDPPRAGLGAKTAMLLAQLGAPEIIYVSCDLATLARDLSVLTASQGSKVSGGKNRARYEIVEMHLFDLFPQTYHIETLVRLRCVS